ncbi:MAG: T9SS type A sorting domain-containing protein [Bacteroidia bacterium]
MNTKSLLSFLFLSYFSANVFGQFIMAGKHGAQDYYHDIIPDKPVYVTINQTQYSFSKDTLLIDINGDNINDFMLIALGDDEAQWGFSEYTAIKPLNNNHVTIAAFDSCFANCTDSFVYRVPMVNPFIINDSINKSHIWTDTIAYLSFSMFSAGNPGFTGGFYSGGTYGCGLGLSFNKFSSDSEYIGVSILVSTGTLYGWIKVKAVTSDSLIVEEYACNLVATGIESYQNKFSVEVYPNPTSGKFTIKSDALQITNVEIYNVLGEKIYSSTQQISNSVIDISFQPSGVYFLKLETDKGIAVKKILKE